MHKTWSHCEPFDVKRDLEYAIEYHQFEVYYQPQVCIDSERTIGFEALVRWRHPFFGILSPISFIQEAEETGLIVEIGNFVLLEACRQYQEWIDLGLKIQTISVNVSVKQLQSNHFISLVKNIIKHTKIHPSALELEITETQTIDSIHNVHSLFKNLNELGVKIAIDDFGVTYSALSYLNYVEIDTIKIDRSFVIDIVDNPRKVLLLSGIINLIKNLGYNIVVEGIETAKQLEIIKLLMNLTDNLSSEIVKHSIEMMSSTCFIHKKSTVSIQGYYYSRPVSAFNIHSNHKSSSFISA